MVALLALVGIDVGLALGDGEAEAVPPLDTGGASGVGEV